MSKFIVGLDYGHGGNDPGALGFGLKEKDQTLEIGKMVAKELRDDYNIKVIETRTTDKTISLAERVNIFNSNKLDLALSIHNNAFNNPKANGIETWYSKGSVKGKKAAEMLQNTIVNDKIFPTNRGIKTTTGLYMVRRPIAPSILVELGFITNKTDNNIITSQKKKIANSIVKGIVKYLGVKPVEKKPTSTTFYRVVTGSYTERSNAEKQIQRLKKAGFNSFLDVYKK